MALLDRGWGKPEQHQTGELTHAHYIARIPAVIHSVEQWQAQHGDPLKIPPPTMEAVPILEPEPEQEQEPEPATEQ